jgi:hypothetical protein
MNAPSSKGSGTQFRQSFVNQTPVYDNQLRKRKRPLSSQVIGAGGILRPDKRKKAHYL